MFTKATSECPDFGARSLRSNFISRSCMGTVWAFWVEGIAIPALFICFSVLRKPRTLLVLYVLFSLISGVPLNFPTFWLTPTAEQRSETRMWWYLSRQ